VEGEDSEIYAYGEEGVRWYTQWWKKDFMRPNMVVGGGEGVWECVRREWFRESISARERRKEMNVRGAIRSLETVLSFGASIAGGARRLVDGD